MIHPDTEVRFISPYVGYGVFATAAIAKGTILYVKDQLEIEIQPNDPLLRHPLYREVIAKYSYAEPSGVRVISWDQAKFVNHSCNPNSLSTGYGFEIAIRDIAAGEEITDDYGVFMGGEQMPCCCGQITCRKVVSEKDYDLLTDQWDASIQQALTQVRQVAQPLWKLLDSRLRQQLETYLESGQGYQSIQSLRCDAFADVLGAPADTMSGQYLASTDSHAF